jgi:GTPase
MLPPVRWADIVFTSALTGQRTLQVFDKVDEAVEQHRKRIKTSVLNEVLRDAVLWQAPPTRKNSQQGKIYYCNQVASRPPTVAIFCNNPKLFGDNYKRYLERKFREQLGFKSTPVRMLWRGKRLRRMIQDESKKSRYPKPYQTG